MQLYKNNARALLSRFLSTLNLDWLQYARSVCGVYEFVLVYIWGSVVHIDFYRLLQCTCCLVWFWFWLPALRIMLYVAYLCLSCFPHHLDLPCFFSLLWFESYTTCLTPVIGLVSQLIYSLSTWSVISGKKITEGIGTNPVTEPFVVSVDIPCMPWRKFSWDSRVLLWNFAPKLWSWNIYSRTITRSKGYTLFNS